MTRAGACSHDPRSADPRSVGGWFARGVSSLIGCVLMRRPSATMGLLLVLMMVAAGEGFAVAQREGQVPRAVAVEARIAMGLEVGVLPSESTWVRSGPQRIAVRSRSCPRWVDPTAGGRPPVRAPDVG